MEPETKNGQIAPLPDNNEPIVYEAENFQPDNKLKKVIIFSILGVIAVAGLIFAGSKVYNLYVSAMKNYSQTTKDTANAGTASNNGNNLNIKYGAGSGMTNPTSSPSPTSSSSSTKAPSSATGTSSGANSTNTGTAGNSTPPANSGGENLSLSRNSGPVGASVTVTVSGIPSGSCFSNMQVFYTANYGSSYYQGPSDIVEPSSFSGGSYSGSTTIPSQLFNSLNPSQKIATPSGSGYIEAVFANKACSGLTDVRQTFTVN